jgi:hypothetical protein
MLHECIGYQDEVTREPAPRGNRHGGEEMVARAQSFLAPNQRADERALHEESEHPFHRKRLPDHRSRVTGETCPVGPELKFHRYSGNHADGKVEAEYLCPKANRDVVLLVAGSERLPLPVNQEPGEPHG